MRSTAFPFTAIVGQGAMKTALLLNAIDHGVGGVLIRGHQGTGKSTTARALGNLLPELEVVSGCRFRCHPDEPDASCEHCRAGRASGGELLRAQAPMPVVELPLNATEDRLVGSIHIEQALQTGERRFEPGLLAAANRGILYVDDVNLLEDHLVDVLLDAAASGRNLVEREGVSFGHPARFILIGSMNPEEGELRPQFLDRFPLCVSVEGIDDAEQRSEVVHRRLAYEADPKAFLRSFAPSEQELAQRVAKARADLQVMPVSARAVKLAVQIAMDLGARGHRADIIMVKAARAFAALLGKPKASVADVVSVARFVLLHRVPSEPLDTPHALLDKIDATALSLAGGEEAEGAAIPIDEDFDELTDRMQIPGASAAGSILFEVEKKSL